MLQEHAERFFSNNIPILEDIANKFFWKNNRWVSIWGSPVILVWQICWLTNKKVSTCVMINGVRMEIKVGTPQEIGDKSK